MRSEFRYNNRISHTLRVFLMSALMVLIMSVPVFASNMDMISAGAGKQMDASKTDTSELSETDDDKELVFGAGEASAQKRYDATTTVTSIMKPSVSSNEVTVSEDSSQTESVSENAEKSDEEKEYDQELKEKEKAHAQALAVVTGEEYRESALDIYTNLGIAKVDNWLNVRKGPSEDSELVGKMPKHAGCEILDEKDGWAHIKSGKVDGYSKLEYLYTGDEAYEVAQDCIQLMATVTTTTLYVRGEPSTESAVITMVPLEETLEVLEELDDWCKISIDDEEGYISKEYVTIAEQLEKAVTMTELRLGQGVSDRRIAMVNYAKQFLGNRYVWGGTSLTNGTDCSGFTMGVYRKFGISLPRVSRSQACVGTKISVADLRPGDLVFYGKGSYINHVAMYIGGGQVIHASSPKTGIKISNVAYRTPITCRRIIGD